jgi:hypothetical protein
MHDLDPVTIGELNLGPIAAPHDFAIALDRGPVDG